MTTNDVNGFAANNTAVAQSSAILDVKGRIIADIRIIKPIKLLNKNVFPSKESLWLLLARNAVPSIQLHFSRYGFKKKLILKDISDNFDFWSYFVE